jgi:hypothetical protein
MQKKVYISQSNYIPWKGYFDAIASVDEFILLDNVQFTRRDWRTRNKIKTANGPHWLSIPVQAQNHRELRINEVRIADPAWAKNHWKTLSFAFSKCPFFATKKDVFAEFYQNVQEEFLTNINEQLIRIICDILGISTPIRRAEEFSTREDPNLRLLDICLQTGASDYYCGPASKAYLDEGLFLSHGVTPYYFDFSNYPEYPQPYPPFDHYVSVLDLIFNTGDESKHLFRGASLSHQ